MLDRRLTPAVLVITLCVSACSTTAVESTAPTQAKAPTIVRLFSPTSVTGESIRDETIRRIDHTAHTLDVAMYSFNEPTLTEALIRAKGRGVSMRVIMDSLQAGGETYASIAVGRRGVDQAYPAGVVSD
jgi:phosphatidylserine/phosphatidylglycerophosphate/cardiolipin synthase-like enzyme